MDYLRLSLPLSLLAFATSVAQAAGYNVEQMMRDLSAKGVHRPDQLIAALPPELRSNVTFVRTSQSLQKGLRAVMFGDTGDFIITLNREGFPGENQAEIFQLNPVTKQYMRYELAFDKSGNSTPLLLRPDTDKKALEKCNECHGSTNLLLWKTYDYWANSLGAMDDHASPEDISTLRVLRADPRFAALSWDPKDPCWPYYCFDRKISAMPNSRMTIITLIRNAQAQSEMVKNHENTILSVSLAYLSLCRGDGYFNSRFSTLVARKIRRPATATGAQPPHLRPIQARMEIEGENGRLYVNWPPLVTQNVEGQNVIRMSREPEAPFIMSGNWV